MDDILIGIQTNSTPTETYSRLQAIPEGIGKKEHGNEIELIELGMHEKSIEFNAAGNSIYSKA